MRLLPNKRTKPTSICRVLINTRTGLGIEARRKYAVLFIACCQNRQPVFSKILGGSEKGNLQIFFWGGGWLMFVARRSSQQLHKCKQCNIQSLCCTHCQFAIYVMRYSKRYLKSAPLLSDLQSFETNQ